MTNGTARFRTAATAGALLTCATLACRTVNPSGSAASLGPAPTGATGTGATAERGGDTPVILFDAEPRLLVTPAGEAYLILHAGRARVPAVRAWDVAYLAGDDAAVLAGRDAMPRLLSSVRDLLDAFRPFVEADQATRFSVTAIFGKSGGPAAVEQLWFAREDGTWGLNLARQATLEQVPAMPPHVVRDPAEEASARAAAAAFIDDLDQADYDAAWAKSSAVIKASMSRVDFERQLASHPRGETDGLLYLSIPATQARFVPGAMTELWMVRATPAGPAVEMVQVRLDDDMVWRVSAVADLAVPAASGRVALQARGARE